MTVFTQFEMQDIINLTIILDDFGKISNLRLNKAKTSISIINRKATLKDKNDIESIGYKLESHSIPILVLAPAKIFWALFNSVLPFCTTIHNLKFTR